MEFVTHLKHEYTQIAVGLFHENLTPVHCSAVVCIHVLPIFLYVAILKSVLQFWNLDLQCSAAW